MSWVSSALCLAWIELTANGTWPPPTHSAAAALQDHRTILLFGGNAFDPNNDLYALDTKTHTWTKKKLDRPPPKREGHSLTSLPDGRLLLFAGYSGKSPLNDLFLLSDDGWSAVNTTNAPPAARDGHSAVLAPDNVTLLVFGGFNGTMQLSDLWALDTRSFSWRELHPGGETPPARCMHCAQPTSDGMLVFGGYAFGDEAEDEVGDPAALAATEDLRFDDVWRLRLGARDEPRWERLEPSGESPPAVFAAASATDAQGRIWVHGGSSGATCSGGLYVLAPEADAESEDAGDEGARDGGSGGVEGAVAGEGALNSEERLHWRRIMTRGPAPSARHKHNLVATRDGRLVLFGGMNRGLERGMFAARPAELLTAADAGALSATRLESVGLAVAQRLGLGLVVAGIVLRRRLLSRAGLLLLALVLLATEPVTETGAFRSPADAAEVWGYGTARGEASASGDREQGRRTPRGGADVASDLSVAGASALGSSVYRAADYIKDQVDTRYKTLAKAFRSFDVEGNGYITEQQLRERLESWQVPVSQRKLRALMKLVNKSRNGRISYAEFVATLACSKQGIQIFGLDDDYFGIQRHIKPTGSARVFLNDNYTSQFIAEKQTASKMQPRVAGDFALPVAKAEPTVENINSYVAQIRQTLLAKFSKWREAFFAFDVDRSGSITVEEFRQALEGLRLPIPANHLASLLLDMDTDGDGKINYEEFADKLLEWELRNIGQR